MCIDIGEHGININSFLVKQYRHTSEILWFQTRVIKQYQNKASQINFLVSKCI